MKKLPNGPFKVVCIKPYNLHKEIKGWGYFQTLAIYDAQALEEHEKTVVEIFCPCHDGKPPHYGYRTATDPEHTGDVVPLFWEHFRVLKTK